MVTWTGKFERSYGSDNKIGLFVSDLGGRGVQRSFVNLSIELDRQGLDVDLVLFRSVGEFLNEVPDTVRIVDLGASRAIKALPALVRYLRRERPRTMITAEDHSNVVTLIARRLVGHPRRIIVSSRVSPTLWASDAPVWTKRFWLRQLVRMTYPMATARVALSNGMADEMSHLFGLRRESLSVIYNPVVTDALLQSARGPLPHPWLATGEPPVILGVGSPTKIKGFDILLQAFAILREQRPVRLMILGQGSEEDTLRRLAIELGIAEDVLLTGFVPNPAAYMTRASQFVLSSRSEGFGNVLVEAMACGCPVVATACSAGPVEILENGLHGPLVPVDNPPALARAMIDRLAAPRNSEALKTRAEIFRVERIVSQYRRILEI
jgi:glycosyltransferase involved in cell wall biosynthesis